MKWTSEDVHKSVVWDDSKTTPHWELSLNSYTLSCDMTEQDYRETVAELLAIVNN
jgi:hypothetical protein